MANKLGVTENIVSRLALGVSLREGPVSDNWKSSVLQAEELYPVDSGKSLKGKTLFKNELAMWMVLLSNVEGRMDSIDVARSKFILHWERGVELIAKQDNDEDWIHLIASLCSPEDSQ
tara:strand:+ start:149 stop:502 length:354 start_codon:yes stop_codon:yes gene_type:complete